MLYDPIKSAFSQAAHSYHENSSFQMKVAELLSEMIPHLQGQSVLELGCGTGHLTRAMAQHHSFKQYLATDYAPQMLDVCRQTCENMDIEYAVLDAASLGNARCPILSGADGGFDWIVSNMCLHWLAEPLGAYLARLQVPYIGFSVPIDGFFEQWCDVLEYNGLKVPMFPSVKMLLDDMPGEVVDVQTLCFDMRFDGWRAFLSYIKASGVYGNRVSDTGLKFLRFPGSRSQKDDVHMTHAAACVVLRTHAS